MKIGNLVTLYDNRYRPGEDVDGSERIHLTYPPTSHSQKGVVPQNCRQISRTSTCPSRRSPIFHHEKNLNRQRTALRGMAEIRHFLSQTGRVPHEPYQIGAEPERSRIAATAAFCKAIGSTRRASF